MAVQLILARHRQKKAKGHGDAKVEAAAIDYDLAMKFSDTFKLFDKDGDGRIEKYEFGEVLKSLGLAENEENVETLMNEFDKDGDGAVDFAEFVAFMSSGQDQVLHAFQKFDPDNTGKISVLTFHNVMTRCGEKVDDETIDAMLDIAEVDAEGMIDYKHYASAMMWHGDD
jgi:Ca2+-binding EF-hand superfamily protein